MARGIRIPFLAEVRDFLRGTSDVESALDDVSDALDDVADNGRDAGRDLGRYLDDGADQAGEAADRAERKFRDAFDTLRSESRDAGRDVDDGVRRGLDDAGEATETFRDETRQNLSESVSSFRGDIEDIPQLVQDVLGGVSADLGMLGGLAAAGAAAVIGVTISKLQEMADSINQAKEEAAALSAEIVETGQGIDGVDLGARLREWALEIGDAREWWELWQSDAVTNMELVSDAARRTGTDVGDVWAAMASSDLDTARSMVDDLRASQEALRSETSVSTAELYGYTGALDDEASAARDTSEANQELIRVLEDHISKREEAEALARAVTAAEHGVSEAVVEQAEALAATTEAQAALAEERSTALDVTRSLAEAEIDYAEQLAKSTEAIAENGTGMDVQTESGRANREALLELSGAALEQAEAMAAAGASVSEVSGYLDTARADFLAAAAAAGVSTSDANRLADAWLGIPSQVATDVTSTAKAAQADTQDYIREVQGIPTSKSTTVSVEATGVQSVKDSIAELTRERTVWIKPMVRPGQVAAI